LKPISMDLRERVLVACDAGAGTKAAAARSAVSESWVRRLKQRRAAGTRVAPKSSRNKRVPKLAAHAEEIRAPIAATPDLTLAEIREQLGVAVALATLWAAVARLGPTVKKSAAGDQAGPTGREDEARRMEDRAAEARPGPAGVPRRDLGEHEHDPNVRPQPEGATAGLRRAALALGDDDVRGGITVRREDGPDGDRRGEDRDRFAASVEQILVPTLRPADVVILDNLVCHKRAGAREAIEAAGGNSCRRTAPIGIQSNGPSRSSRGC